MDSYRVNYTDEALQDLRDIFDYISVELQERNTAAAQIKRIRDEVRSLNIFPSRHKAVDWEPWSKQGMRQLPVDKFIVFYIINDPDKSIQIVRILYGRRDFPGLAKK